MTERDRFVPRRVGQLTGELAAIEWDDPSDGDRFQAFSRLTSALYHYEFHAREQAVIEAWEGAADESRAASTLTAELSGLLDGANYIPVSMAELDEAMTNESLIPLRLDVDLDDYDELMIYRRGAHQETVSVPRFHGLRTSERIITVDERVAVHTRIKRQEWFDQKGIDAGDRNLQPGHVSLKLFQNVPRADIEMLLPSTQVRFRPIDTLIVGVPALVSGLAVLVTKLLPTLGLIGLVIAAGLGFRDETPDLDQTAMVILFGGAVTLGGFGFRQWTKLKNRRVDYLKTLSENLYFRTLADGPGVVHTLLSSAEQQEVAEVLLAYRFLLAAPDGSTVAELDRTAERWLQDNCQQDIDFEVDDAVGKLRRLGVIDDEDGNDGAMRAVPLPVALRHLDARWDDLFRYRVDDEGDTDELAAAAGATGAGQAAKRGQLIRLRRVLDRFGGRLGGRLTRREGA